MKSTELKNKTVIELQNELLALLKEQFSMRIQKGTSEVVQTHPIKRVRREIARVKTILREKEGS